MRAMKRLICAGLAVFALTGCTTTGEVQPTPTPLPAASVSLSLSGQVANQVIRIGVVVAAKQSKGAAYQDVADGVRVAAYRFQMTGATIETNVAIDDGTADGLAGALSQLASQNTIGVIVASAGPHVRQALAEVDIAQPILLPYDIPGTVPNRTWTTGPSLDALNQGIKQALTGANASRPIVVAEPGQPDLRIERATYEPLASDVASRVVGAISAATADSVVIAASAINQAKLVAEIQQGLGARQIPMILTPQALTPLFTRTLAAYGMPSSPLISVGANTTDSAALAADSAGAQASAFFTALSLAANDQSCLNIFADAAFAESASTADIASHDATIALIRAAEKAGTTSPTAVAQALSALTVQPKDGLAGPALDFHAASALSATAVHPLHASDQDLGLRPVGGQLAWFPN